jgi:hypothetical protein
MGVLKDTVVHGAMAVGNLVAGERSRPEGKGRLDERIKQRVQDMAADGAAKTATSVAAPHAARELAKRAGVGVVGRVAAGLAARPLVAAGAALWVYDAVSDGVRVARGTLKPSQAVEHLTGSASGLAGGAGGAYAGAVLGSMLIPVPVVGTLVGMLLGGVAGSVAADGVGRAAVRRVLEAGKATPPRKK